MFAGAADLRWARGAMSRQFAFKAAAYAQRELARHAPRRLGQAAAGAIMECVYGVLGSDAGLRALGLLQGFMQRVARQGPAPEAGAGR